MPTTERPRRDHAQERAATDAEQDDPEPLRHYDELPLPPKWETLREELARAFAIGQHEA